MITSFDTPKHHWNYYLAIEKDLENVSRYIEFSQANFGTYSIELAHILLSASSEVDVLMKQLCALLDPSSQANNITEYRHIIKGEAPSLSNEEVRIHRFGLRFTPWLNWNGDDNPEWWKSHNKVKHERNNHFSDANLQHAINAVGALMLTAMYYYQAAFSSEAKTKVKFPDVTRQLEPQSSLIRASEKYYYQNLIL